ncbi:DUF6726 family protein [Nitrospirillum sp. BR 11828]|uniref:DUF6726 family protein n=1 Tax=Nitrospirillum sp. BR 11828 TaxID=3104325 RepID=UPI002ACAEDBE|nr:DUF6726 family protein [Nitrospirillum sp. BR 11828]MDZ5646653.1 DUF6726 family protein [Nitrospirillum sp. BR 11828]
MISRSRPAPQSRRDRLGRLGRVALVLAAAGTVSGCSGLVALPVRTASAVVKVVPVAGDIAAKPLDAAADAID